MNPPSAAVLLFAALLAAWSAPQASAQQAPAPPSPTAEEIQQAVRQLSAPSFSARQEASDLLWRAGRQAEPALRQALESSDREVVFRAESILEQFRFGIFPDTPPQIIGLIESFREGNLGEKQLALRQLQERGATGTMLRLMRAEPNAVIREELVRQLVGNVKTLVPDLLAAGNFDDAEDLLELTAASSDEGMRHLGVFLLLTGRLERRIAALRQELKTGGDDTRRRLLIFLLRTEGKLDEALVVAGELDPRFDFVREELRFQDRDWEALAKQYSEKLKTNPALESNVEFLGYAAAVHRLAGDRAALERDVAAVKKLNADSEQGFFCAEALLVNGRFDDGIEILREWKPESAFRLLAGQMRYREAFALAGLGEKGENDQQWFADLARDLQTDDEGLRGRFGLGLAVARTLFRLGERERAAQGLATIGRALEKDQDANRLESLCEVERKLRFRQQALDHAAQALEKKPGLRALELVFPEHGDEAKVWWEFFRQQRPQDSHRASLDRVEALLAPDEPSAGGEANAAEDAAWRGLVAQAEKAAAALDDVQRGLWLQSLAETCLLHDDRGQARRLLVEAAGVSTAAALRLGDLHAEDEDWRAAAESYEKAEKDVDLRPLAYYLRGGALEKAGDEQEGRRLKELGQLLPLADGAARRELADGLKQRGLLDDAVAQWRLTLHSSAFRDWYTSNAALNLGNALSGKDPLGAADNWETLALSVLKTSSAFIEPEGYLQLPHLVHKARASGLLAEGKKSEAVENLWISQAAYPGDVDLAEDLIPQLEEAGLQATADELFTKVYAPNERLCRDFPRNASAHNNLAWLAARNGRRLDEALEHARRAVDLEPENSAYLDTLAEALFRTGKRQEAIDLEERCLAKEPKNEHFLKQLARFKKTP